MSARSSTPSSSQYKRRASKTKFCDFMCIRAKPFRFLAIRIRKFVKWIDWFHLSTMNKIKLMSGLVHILFVRQRSFEKKTLLREMVVKALHLYSMSVFKLIYFGLYPVLFNSTHIHKRERRYIKYIVHQYFVILVLFKKTYTR